MVESPLQLSELVFAELPTSGTTVVTGLFVVSAMKLELCVLIFFSGAHHPDLNKDILEEADQEEAIGGAVTAEASPLSLLSTGSAIPYASMGTAAPTTISMSAGPMWGGSAAPAGRVPTAIVNGQPVYSNNPGDPFGGTLRGPSSARPVNLIPES